MLFRGCEFGSSRACGEFSTISIRRADFLRGFAAAKVACFNDVFDCGRFYDLSRKFDLLDEYWESADTLCGDTTPCLQKMKLKLAWSLSESRFRRLETFYRLEADLESLCDSGDLESCRTLWRHYALENDVKEQRITQTLCNSFQQKNRCPINLPSRDQSREEEFKRLAQECDSGTAKSCKIYGVLQYKRGDRRGAIDSYFKACLSSKVKSDSSCLALGLASYMAGQLENAKDAFVKSCARDPSKCRTLADFLLFEQNPKQAHKTLLESCYRFDLNEDGAIQCDALASLSQEESKWEVRKKASSRACELAYTDRDVEGEFYCKNYADFLISFGYKDEAKMAYEKSCRKDKLRKGLGCQRLEQL